MKPAALFAVLSALLMLPVTSRAQASQTPEDPMHQEALKEYEAAKQELEAAEREVAATKREMEAYYPVESEDEIPEDVSGAYNAAIWRRSAARTRLEQAERRLGMFSGDKKTLEKILNFHRAQERSYRKQANDHRRAANMWEKKGNAKFAEENRTAAESCTASADAAKAKQNEVLRKLWELKTGRASSPVPRVPPGTPAGETPAVPGEALPGPQPAEVPSMPGDSLPPPAGQTPEERRIDFDKRLIERKCAEKAGIYKAADERLAEALKKETNDWIIYNRAQELERARENYCLCLAQEWNRGHRGESLPKEWEKYCDPQPPFDIDAERRKRGIPAPGGKPPAEPAPDEPVALPPPQPPPAPPAGNPNAPVPPGPGMPAPPGPGMPSADCLREGAWHLTFTVEQHNDNHDHTVCVKFLRRLLKMTLGDFLGDLFAARFEDLLPQMQCTKIPGCSGSCKGTLSQFAGQENVEFEIRDLRRTGDTITGKLVITSGGQTLFILKLTAAPAVPA